MREWPFMLKSTHDALMTVMDNNLNARLDLVLALRAEIDKKNEQIRVLTELLAQKSVIITHEQPKSEPKSSTSTPTPGLGWRGKRQMASEATIPQAGDSVRQLNERVEKDGGTV